MNKKGFALIFALMVGVVLFLLGLALAPALQQITDEQMDDPVLNCSTTANPQLKAVCTSIEMQNLFIGIIFGVAGIIIMRSI